MRSAMISVVVLAVFVIDGRAEDVPLTAVAGNARQQYFLIDHSEQSPPANRKLLLVLPGGDGSAEFHPFVSNLARHAAGDDYVVAQLVAVKWAPSQRIVWPTKEVKVEGMKFTTEEFIGAVIRDVSERKKIDPGNIYTLSWSSSGPACYAASLRVKQISGSFVAMSVFKPDQLPQLAKAKGHRYYIYHSPEDRVCPLRMAKDAEKRLAAEGAKVKLESYDGGHGWRGNVFGEINRGLKWLAEEQR